MFGDTDFFLVITARSNDMRQAHKSSRIPVHLHHWRDPELSEADVSAADILKSFTEHR